MEDWEILVPSYERLQSLVPLDPLREAIMDLLKASYEAGKRAGRQEVIDFVDKHLHDSPACSYSKCFSGRVWQAFKEGK